MVGLPALRRDTASTTPLGVVCFLRPAISKRSFQPRGADRSGGRARWMHEVLQVCQVGRGHRIRSAAWIPPCRHHRPVHLVSGLFARAAVAVDKLMRRERCSILCRGGCFESCRGPSIFVHPHLVACFLAPSSGSPLARPRPLPEEPRVDEIYRAMGTTEEQQKSPSGQDLVCGEVGGGEAREDAWPSPCLFSPIRGPIPDRRQQSC